MRGLRIAVVLAVLGTLFAVTPALGGPSITRKLQALTKRVGALAGVVKLQTQALETQDARIGSLENHRVRTVVRVKLEGALNGIAAGTATCLPGEVALGGGATFEPSSTSDRIIYSHPAISGDAALGWRAAGATNSFNNLRIEVICSGL